jgi:hypothetical protein
MTPPLFLAALPPGPAERVAYMIGVILPVVVCLGVMAFTAVAIVKACRKPTRGWIISAVAGCVAVFAMGVIMFILAVPEAARNPDFPRPPQTVKATESAEVNVETAVPSSSAAPAAEPPPKPAVSSTLTGSLIPFTIEKPAGWWVKRSQGVYDVLMSNDQAYIGVIAEDTDLGGAETVATLARERINTSATDVTMTANETVQIDGRSWIAFTAKCKVQGVPFAYQYYVYSGKVGTVQILGWMYQKGWDRDIESTRKTMQTLRLPAAVPAAPAADNP